MQFKNLFTLLALLAAVSVVAADAQSSDGHAATPAPAGALDQDVLARPGGSGHGGSSSGGGGGGGDSDSGEGDSDDEHEVNAALSGNAESSQQHGTEAAAPPPSSDTTAAAFTGDAQAASDPFTGDATTAAAADPFTSDLRYRPGTPDRLTHRLLRPFLRQQTDLEFVLENRRHRTCMMVERPPLHHYHHRWQLRVKRCHSANVAADRSMHLRWYYADENQPHLRKLAWSPDHGATWLCATSSPVGIFFDDCRHHGDLISLSQMNSHDEVMLQLAGTPNRCYGDILHHDVHVERCRRAREQLDRWTPRLIRPYPGPGLVGGGGVVPFAPRPTVVVRDQVQSEYSSSGRGYGNARLRRSSVTRALNEEEEEE